MHNKLHVRADILISFTDAQQPLINADHFHKASSDLESLIITNHQLFARYTPQERTPIIRRTVFCYTKTISLFTVGDCVGHSGLFVYMFLFSPLAVNV